MLHIECPNLIPERDRARLEHAGAFLTKLPPHVARLRVNARLAERPTTYGLVLDLQDGRKSWLAEGVQIQEAVVVIQALALAWGTAPSQPEREPRAIPPLTRTVIVPLDQPQRDAEALDADARAEAEAARAALESEGR